MNGEQYRCETELKARIKAGILSEAGQHGAIIASPDQSVSGGVVYYVETDPVGMIRTWEKELFTF